MEIEGMRGGRKEGQRIGWIPHLLLSKAKVGLCRGYPAPEP